MLPDEPRAAPLAAFIGAIRDGAIPAADSEALDRYELGRLTTGLAEILDGLGSATGAKRRTASGEDAGRDGADTVRPAANPADGRMDR